MKNLNFPLFSVLTGLVLASFFFFWAGGFFGSLAGKLVLTRQVLGGRGIFTFPWPPEKIKVLSKSSFTIQQSPVYLFFFSPRPFSEAQIKIQSSSQDYLLGVLVARDPDVYEYQQSSSGVFQVDLSTAYYSDHRYGLVLSSSNTPITIDSLSLKLWSRKK